jgi:hypothetical protein
LRRVFPCTNVQTPLGSNRQSICRLVPKPVRVCECVCERERERGGGRENVCVCTDTHSHTFIYTYTYTYTYTPQHTHTQNNKYKIQKKDTHTQTHTKQKIKNKKSVYIPGWKNRCLLGVSSTLGTPLRYSCLDIRDCPCVCIRNTLGTH